MSFLAPAAFWFLTVLPIVILFYLLKRRRIVKLVPSTLLWRRFLAESQASAPFQRLRKNWLLLLQLLVLLLLVFALARPFLPSEARPAQRRVVILDGSASMKATDVKPSRFEAARTEALKWVDNLRQGEEMVVVQAGAETLVRQSATRNQNALRRALQGCTASDGPTRLVPALQMAESLVRDQPHAEIHLFSDGATAALGEFENRGLPLVYHKIGIGSNNLAISAIDSRPSPEDPDKRTVYVAVANFSGQETVGSLDLHFDGRLVETRPITIASGESASEVFTAHQNRDGIYTATLNVPDDLSVDNIASISSLLPKPVHVALITRGNRFLEKALSATEGVVLTVSTGLKDPVSRFDIVVIDGVQPDTWPSANLLAFKAWDTNWFTDVTSLKAPSIVDWRSTHPLMRYAGFEEVGIAESLAAKPPAWGISLLDSPQASLMVAGEFGRQRVVWAGFDPLDSNWPLRVSFPIFIANAVEWLRPAVAQGGSFMVRAGEPYRLQLPESAQTAVVLSPSGKEHPVTIGPNDAEFVFARTFEQGVYKVQLDTNTITFCVNLLDAQESRIGPRDELNLGERNRVVAAKPQRASIEIWRALAALGLLLLLAEWWYYHRRTA